MTQEEYEREQQEIKRLINEINRLVDENNRLTNEINEALENINILRNNVVTLHNNLEPRMRGVSRLAWANFFGWVAMLALQIPLIIMRWRKEQQTS